MAEISVIIPAYCCAKSIERALKSVCSQAGADAEIICVDDASSDSTPLILRRLAAADSRIRVLTHSQNQGAYKARVTGLKASTAPLVIFVDSDDILLPGALQTIHRVMSQSGSDMAIFGSDIQFPYLHLRRPYTRPAGEVESRESQNIEVDWLELLSGATICTLWAKAYRRDLLLEHLPAETDSFVAEDYYLNCAVMPFCKKISYCNSPTYRVTFSGGNSKYYLDRFDQFNAIMGGIPVLLKQVCSARNFDLNKAMQAFSRSYIYCLREACTLLLSKRHPEQAIAQFMQRVKESALWQTLQAAGCRWQGTAISEITATSMLAEARRNRNSHRLYHLACRASTLLSSLLG